MKKAITTLVTLGALATSANADLTRIEMGGGMWSQDPSGSIKNKVNFSNSAGEYIDNSDKKSTDLNYVWAYIKHPLPILPNLRAEYSSVENVGTVSSTGAMALLQTLKDIHNGDKTYLEATQYDIIPYYNLLDNTFWVSLDLGLDIKVMDIQYSVNNKEQLNTTAPIPLLYLRARGEVPFVPSLGVEGIVKWISDGGDNTVYDVLIKADYTFKVFPIVEPGIEVGYRIMNLTSKVDDGDTTSNIDLTFQGVYFGGMLRF